MSADGPTNPPEGHDNHPEQPEVLPSGAVRKAAGDTDPDRPASPSRRALFTGIGIGAAVIAAGAAGWGVWRSSNSTGSWAGRELALVYGGDVCEAPLYAAYEQGFFEQQGLNVVLRKTGTGEDTHAAVGSGKYVAAPGIFFSWLKPIEQGQDVKLAAGLHEGCLRLVINKDSDIAQVADLKGKKIGVSGLQGSALNFFSLDLLDAGIVPSPEAKQIEWVVIDNDLLPQALKDGKVDAIAASDPIALLPTLESEGAWAKELTNNRHGHNAQQYCCATALNGALIREDPDTARKLVTAWADGSRWVGSHIEETAQLEIDKNYVAGADAATVAAILKTYSFEPSASKLRAALVPGIEKFAGTGFLDAKTNAAELADKVYVDLGLDW